MRSKNKYGVRTDALGKAARTADGMLFASQRECSRYKELQLLERRGIIRKLHLQPRYPLYAVSTYTADLVAKVCEYVADFEYEEHLAPGAPEIVTDPCDEGWMTVTEDVKGAKTALYKLKAKWFRACYGREIRET